MTERMMSKGESRRLATIAASESLSPNAISSTLTVSFSLMIGMTLYSKRLRSVFRTLMYRDRSLKSSVVRSICATWWPCLASAWS